MKKLIKFYFEHKKLCVIAMFALVAFVVFKNDGIAFAADTVKEAPDPTLKDTMQGISQIGYVILQFASMLLWPVLVMIGSLLDNDLIFGGEMGARLLSVWVEIRNIVNVVFVLILLAIAVYNVLGLGEEGGGLPLAFKTVLPKFVLALIAVNFSFLGVKVILDFTNVLTGAVFSLPARVETSSTLKQDFQTMICGPNNDQVPLKGLWCTNDNKLNDKAEAMFSKLDRTNIAIAYAIQFGRAPNLKFVKDGLKDIGQLGFNIIFNTVLYVVYALSFIALLIVLLFRTVALWIGVVLSPLMALSIVLPNLKDLAGGGGELKDQFVKNAIAPIKIGLVLSIGYIMLNGFAADKGIHGDILSTSQLSSLDPNSLPTDITDLQQLMIAVGVIVIVWTGVFKAADETAAKSITGMIRDKAQSFGKFAATLPMYAQVLPTGLKNSDGTSRSASIAELGATLDDIPGRARGKWGRSLFEPPVDQDAVNRISRATDMRTLGQAIAASPGVLKTKTGFDAFEQAMLHSTGSPYKDKPEDFKRKFPNGFASLSASNLEEAWSKGFGTAVREANPNITSAKDLMKAIESGATGEADKVEPVTDPNSAAQTISERSAKSLAADKAFKGGLREDDIEILKKFPAEMLSAWLVVKDGKVTMNDKGQAALKLSRQLKDGTSIVDAQRFLGEALVLGDGEKKKIVDASDLGVKDDQNLFKPASAASTRGDSSDRSPPLPPQQPPAQAAAPAQPAAQAAPAVPAPTPPPAPAPGAPPAGAAPAVPPAAPPRTP
jgi:hypothetical protein